MVSQYLLISKEILLIIPDLTQSAWGVTIDAQPSLGIDDDFMNVSSASLDVSDMNSLSSTWFAGDDFDLDALNSAIQESIAHYAYPMQSYPTDHRTQLPSIEYVETEGVFPTHPSLPPLYSSSISKKWFSNIEVDQKLQKHVKAVKALAQLRLMSMRHIELISQVKYKSALTMSRYHPQNSW